MLQKREVFYCHGTVKLRNLKLISHFVSEINCQSRTYVKVFAGLQAFQKDQISNFKITPNSMVLKINFKPDGCINNTELF